MFYFFVAFTRKINFIVSIIFSIFVFVNHIEQLLYEMWNINKFDFDFSELHKKISFPFCCRPNFFFYTL